MSKQKKHADASRRRPGGPVAPVWASPREDSLCETVVVDCAAVSPDCKPAEVASALKAGSGGEILLRGLGGFSEKGVLAMLKAARAAGFESVKAELDITRHFDAGFYGRLFGGAADEVFVALPDVEGKPAARRAVMSAVGGIAASAKKRAGLLRVIVKCGGGRELERTLAALSAAGAEYVIADCGGAAASLAGVCEHAAAERGVSVELRAGGETRAFRSEVFKAREAERQFIETPYYVIGGEAKQLGLVFQLDFRCNQKCVFCTSDKSLPRLDDATRRRLIARSLESKPSRVVFTGGEPTLDKNLFKYIALAKDAGVLEAAVYTNAMAFADAGYARRAVDAGLDLALVSLHSQTASVSDRITGCAGGYDKTVRGLENLRELGVFTVINYVVNGINYAGTPDFVRFVAGRFPAAALNFSYVAPIMEETASAEIVPRFSDAVPLLNEAMDLCDSLGVVAAGLEPHWGVTPCAMGDGRLRYFPILPPLSQQYSGFVKAASCAECGLDACCPGVRRNYAKLYGTSELKPVL